MTHLKTTPEERARWRAAFAEGWDDEDVREAPHKLLAALDDLDTLAAEVGRLERGLLALTPALANELYTCISVRLALIETGDPVLRAVDAVNSGQPKLVKPLDRRQRELINSLEDVQTMLLRTR